MAPNLYMLMDLLLSGGINYLLQKQQVDALLTKAFTEKRDILMTELATLKVERDRVSDEVFALLDAAAQEA